MARWNNGYTEYSNGSATSEKNYPQNGANSAVPGLPLSHEARQRQALDAVRRSRGRFTSRANAAYRFSDVQPFEHQRGNAALPFVDFPGAKLSDGGDLRDMNGFGGGMPDSNTFVGRGVPSRKSVYNRYLPLAMDHKSPVPRV